MEKQEYLNEERYQKNNLKVKRIGNLLLIIGIILLSIGLVLVLGGFLGFGKQISNGIEMGQQGINSSNVFSGIGSFAIGGFLIGPGFMLTFIGFVLRVIIANKREITAYTAQQMMPLAQEGIEKMTPTIGKATGTIAKEISKGIKEGLKDDEKKDINE